MSDATARGWGTATAPGYREQHITSCKAGGISVPVHKAVADVFRYLFTKMSEHYTLAGYADDWGYCLRCIRGTGPGLHDPSCVLSNHSWGLAVDLDASVNPMTKDLHAAHEFIRAVVDPILAPFGGRLVWGGEYTGPRKDYMHFEYVGPLSAAAADSALARQILAKPATAWVDLSRNSTGGQVRRVQHALRIPLTNVFDQATVVAVRRFQHDTMKVTPTGVVDAATAKALRL